MKTVKLYYEDSHLRHFSARVLSCEAAKGGYLVTLDATAFTPKAVDKPATWAAWAMPRCWMYKKKKMWSSICATNL